VFYSCFNANTGLYDYFSDGDPKIPINGDLPIPDLPTPTQIGVAAIEVGRPMPSSARMVGQGWHARGQIVQCGRGPMGAIPSANQAWGWATTGGGWKWIVLGAAAVWIAKRI
jgi:hypothetical protein